VLLLVGKVVLLLLPLWSSMPICWLHDTYKNLRGNSLGESWLSQAW
jgi:hypothetical protein